MSETEEAVESPGTEETPEVEPTPETPEDKAPDPETPEEPEKEEDPGVVVTPPPEGAPHPDLLSILRDKKDKPEQGTKVPIKGGYRIAFDPAVGSSIHIKQLQLEKTIQELERINSELKAVAFGQKNLQLEAQNLGATRQELVEKLGKVKEEFVELTKKHGLPTKFDFDRKEDGSYVITVKP